jgi:hypothetical protein
LYKEPVKFRIIPRQKLIKLALESEDSGRLKIEIVVEQGKEKNRFIMIAVFFHLN